MFLAHGISKADYLTLTVLERMAFHDLITRRRTS